MTAPLAPQEDIVIEKVEPVQASAQETVNTPPSPVKEIKTNGAIPTISLDESLLPYEPEQTIIDDLIEESSAPIIERHPDTPEEITSRVSLEQQLRDLEEEVARKESFSKSNHVEEPITEENITSNNVQPTNNIESVKGVNSNQVSPAPPKGVSCCRVFMYTFFFLCLTLTVVIVVLVHSDIKHPLLDQVKQQVKFIDPVRDYLLHSMQLVKQQAQQLFKS